MEGADEGGSIACGRGQCHATNAVALTASVALCHAERLLHVTVAEMFADKWL